MKDGTYVNTAKAKESWVGGYNNDDYCIKETLYLSSKGRFYLHSWDELECETKVFYVENKFAIGWLLENGKEIPESLQGMLDEIEE